MVLPCNTSCQVASTIVGIGIGKNYGNIKNLKDDVIIQFTPPEVRKKQSYYILYSETKAYLKIRPKAMIPTIIHSVTT